MLAKKVEAKLIFAVLLMALLMSLSVPKLASSIRFGIEFKGGYEIYYVVEPGAGKTALAPGDMAETVHILQKRADSIGMAEPEIRVEGDNHIRVKLAGVTSADESRSLIGSSVGLPTTLTEKYTQTVGSVLGKSALHDTLLAGLIGIACIFTLLIVLYRGVGLIAAFATIVYLWLLLIAFNLSHATLSLSAIVAFVLGIGMAADASIICFERVREDLKKGLQRPDAIRMGFKESFMTIRDANSVTALAMMALFVAGIGPIQGFSITMLVSIVISMATNFFLVRVLAGWLAQLSYVPESLFIGASRLKTSAMLNHFNFLKFGKVAALCSMLVITSGGLYYKAHGWNLDIDFTAGTALDIDLKTGIDQDTATAIMTEAGTVPATVAIGGKMNEHIAARFDEILKPAELKKIISAFQAKYNNQVVYEENTADPGVAQQFARRAFYALIAAFVSIGLYIGFRFSWSIAFATLIPILHDILLVSAIFALFKFEVDVTYIAALLTVIGYSLNDKIVIFGRIRENREHTQNSDIRKLINRSVHQTLGRSIFTVLTVVMASLALYFFACEPLQMFALALVIGLLSGAYSSIFLSTLLWEAFSRKNKPHRPLLASEPFLAAFGMMAVILIVGFVAIEPPGAKSVNVASKLTTSALGDLSPFEKIAADTLALVEKNDMSMAKDRIKALETAWDQSKNTLQAADSSGWTTVDKSIDRVLTDLRSPNPDVASCKLSLKVLLSKFDTLQSNGKNLGLNVAISHDFGPLGNLSPFSNIAKDTLSIVEKGDFPAAKTRIRDLEKTWDDAEESLSTKSPDYWTSIDKSIDRVLSQVRSGNPDADACKQALKTLIAKLDTMQSPN